MTYAVKSMGDIIVERAEKRMKSAEVFHARGDQYLREGKRANAEGCYKKAERNMALATKELQALPTWQRGVKVG